MAIAIQMPALSPTMKEGKITRWLKKEGDTVSSGTAVAEVETDKSNLEVEAYDDGVLIKVLVKEGAAARVGWVIAYIGKAGEKAPDAPAVAMAAPAAAAVAAVPVAAVAAPVQVLRAASAPMAAVAAVAAPAAANGRLRVSPLARRMAQETGVDLAAVPGSGPNGRVVKRDIEQVMAQGPAKVKSSRPAAVTNGVRLAAEVLPVSSMRKVIASRMAEVKPGVPHFYLTVDLEMDQALKLREEARAKDLKISVNDVVIKAVAVAVRRFPRINQQLDGGQLVQLHNVDVGVAVAIEDGLITPVVRDADQKGLEEIAAEVRDYAERARKRALKPDEYTGGSITVSNLGMYGIDEFIAVINPPQSAILAVGAVAARPVVRDGQVVVRQMMSITLSGDHRVIDGAVGAEFLKELRSLVEHPLRLLL